VIKFISNQKVEIDIHHMLRAEAKRYLEQTLRGLDGSVREAVVIHGYSGGTVLRDMVRALRHPRIREKMVGLNPGATTLFLQSAPPSSRRR
jgi:hypothetical protein